MQSDVDLDAMARAAKRCPLPVRRGTVTAVRDLCLEARLPGARIGMSVEVRRPGEPPIPAEVASCRGSEVGLLPLDHTAGVGPGDEVVAVAAAETIPCGRGLLGRIVDPFGRPLDGGAPPRDVEPWDLRRPAPDPMTRAPVEAQLVTGVRAIDGCLALGRGQRVGLFAGPGLGKSTLLAGLARRAECDASAICLVGERGREAKDLVDRALGPEGLARAAVVLATADAPPLARVRALETATAIAEWFRDRGEHALLLVDSLTRVARARRDLALALGEPAARGGYPASALAAFPGLLERAGSGREGSITAVYAVLTEGADDPVAEEARSLLDGHIVLSEKLARSGRWPAIDVVRSVSRVMDAVAPDAQRDCARALRRLLGAHEENEDLILMGAYRRGASRDTDLALDRKERIDAFLAQGDGGASPIEETRSRLAELVAGV